MQLQRAGQRLTWKIGPLLKSVIVGVGVLAIMGSSLVVYAESSSVLVGNHPNESTDFLSGPEISQTRTLEMRVLFKLRNEAQLEQLIAAQQDKSSPQYHQWLTPAEFNSQFGPTDSDIAAVSSWLASKGFSVGSTGANRRMLNFSGSAASAETAFGVKIRTDDTGTLYTNVNDPVIPQSLASKIQAIGGLSNTITPHPNLKSEQLHPVPDTTIGTSTAFGPSDIYSFYDQAPPTDSSNDGSGADCIAVIEDSDFPLPDVDAFDGQFQVEPIVPTELYATTDPGYTGEDEIEALLDVEYSHAAAPGAPIYAYIGNENDTSSGSGLLDAAILAVDKNTCGVISISFSFCGVAKSFYRGAINDLMAQAASQGQAVTVAAGDEGAAALVLNKKKRACVVGSSAGVNELAADPFATGVGGTQFPVVDSYTTEAVWNEKKVGAGGGGNSKVFAKPSFQAGFLRRVHKRTVPDVSFAASPVAPGFFFGYDTDGIPGIYCCIGGTSMGAPYWAGIITLAAQKEGVARIGSPNTTLYSIETAGGTGLHDITVGKNNFHGVAGFKAVPGYDRASGLGTPDINLLLDQFAP